MPFNYAQLLVVGDTDQPEFRDAVARLIVRGAATAANMESAIEFVQRDCAPVVIIIAESWPGQYSHSKLDRLRRAAPLARIVGLLGPWLEGETRTGKPWPTMQRAYWHQAQPRFELLFGPRAAHSISPTVLVGGNLHSGVGPSSPYDDQLSLPLTASDEERLLSSTGSNPLADEADRPQRRVIAICARHRDTAESLIDVCLAKRWKNIWLRKLPVETPLVVDAALLDVRLNLEAELPLIASLKKILGPAPIVALLGFPRYDDVDQLQSAGVAAVISKPFLASDLIRRLEQLMQNVMPNG